MAAVNSWEEIPGGIGDEGTCSNNGADCYAAFSSLTSLLTSYAAILTTVDDTLSSLESAIATTGEVEGHFVAGAYDDGQSEYVENLGNYSTDLTSVQTDLTSFRSSLATAMNEITELIAYCQDRADTWNNAAAFIREENLKMNSMM